MRGRLAVLAVLAALAGGGTLALQHQQGAAAEQADLTALAAFAPLPGSHAGSPDTRAISGEDAYETRVVYSVTGAPTMGDLISTYSAEVGDAEVVGSCCAPGAATSLSWRVGATRLTVDGARLVDGHYEVTVIEALAP